MGVVVFGVEKVDEFGKLVLFFYCFVCFEGMGVGLDDVGIICWCLGFFFDENFEDFEYIF